MREKRLSWARRGRLWLRLGIRAALAAAAVLVLVHVVLPAMDLIMPFLLALLVAWMLNPLVRAIQRRLSISRKTISLLLIILLCGALGGALFGLGWMGFDQGRSLVDNWGGIRSDFLLAVDELSHWARHVGGWLPSGMLAVGEDAAGIFSRWVASLDVGGWVADLAAQAPAVITGLTGTAIGVVVFLMASYFITGDYPQLRQWVVERLPSSSRDFLNNVRHIVIVAFGGYIRSQVLLSLCVFVILAVGFVLIGQPYGLLLAMVFAVMDFIPIIGAGTVLVPWGAVCLILGDWRSALERLVLWGIIALFRRVAEPKVLGDQTGLSPILSLVGIYVGMRLGGVLGMVLGPMLLLVLLNLSSLGIFDGVVADLRLAISDIAALLRAGREEEAEES